MICGFINLLKPPGISSHKIVLQIRKLLETPKIGHLGTLDPLAAGVLPLAVGKATKLIPLLPPQRKAYLAEITLGIKTKTDDAEGEILAEAPPPQLTTRQLKKALAAFKGSFLQIPPLFSAIHYQGKRLYQLARSGVSLKPPPRKVEVFSIKLQDFDSPRITIYLECSPGTYIRAIARDLGEKLGSFAYLSFLIRVKSGNFMLKDAFSYQEIEAACLKGEIDRILIPPSEVIPDERSLVLSGN